MWTLPTSALLKLQRQIRSKAFCPKSVWKGLSIYNQKLLPGRKNVCSAAKEQWTTRVTCGNPLPGLPSPHALVVILVLQEYRFPSWSLLSLQESHPRGAEQGVSLELHKVQSQTRVKGNSSEFHLNPIKSTAGSSVTHKPF